MRLIPLFILTLFALPISSSQGNSKPNVLILLTDDQGTLDVNCYGAKDLNTPHMDSLAETGIRFTQAYAHAVCCPSRAALLTGRHPNRGGVQSWLQGDRNGSDAHLGNMDPSEFTLAEVLKEAGFDQHFGHLSGFIDNYTHYFLHGQGYHDLYDNNEEIYRRNEYFPVMMVDEAVKYIGTEREVPFFATVAFNLPPLPRATAAGTQASLPRTRDAAPILRPGIGNG